MASMPATTASRRARYSSSEIRGTPLFSCGEAARGLVRGKLAHRLCDLLRAGHEELLLGSVERHRGHIRRADAHDRAVQAVECMLRDGRRDLGTEAAREVVLVNDHRLAGLAHRRDDGFTVQRYQRSQVDHLDADAVT